MNGETASSAIRQKLPGRRPGQSPGPRHISGTLLDVRHAALFLGVTEKTLRARVARRLVPFRRLGGRVVFVKGDLEAFLSSLGGCSVEEALTNVDTRGGCRHDGEERREGL